MFCLVGPSLGAGFDGGRGDWRRREHGYNVGHWTGLLSMSPRPSAGNLIFTRVPISPPIHLHRIKQPALKFHGGKDSICKPCHMAQLASVCGSDGHTYSSVVRSLGPVWGGGGVYPMPRGTEGPLADPLKILRIDTGLRQYVQCSSSVLAAVIRPLAGRGQEET